MTSEYLHIVCLDAPYPPDYGGAIDMYYKITTLHSIGKKIILHYFNYKENRSAEGLLPYCEEINAYGRTSFLKSLLTLKPYIVSSRIEPDLIHRLNRDNYPVLLEGIHSSGILPHLSDRRKIVVRIHNNEAEYYKTLYEKEIDFVKRMYFLYESELLKTYQKTLPAEATYAFISSGDEKTFLQKYSLPHTEFIPSFIPWQTISSKAGNGEYCLYHGNLSISENREAALWLIENVFSKLNVPLIIAGRNAQALEGNLAGSEQVQLVSDPTETELMSLIQNAQVNVLPSMNTTGVKLKLLHALFEGRFCFSNTNGIAGSGIVDQITECNTADGWIEQIQQKMKINFTEKMIEQRKNILSVYNNTVNAQKLNALL